MTKFSKLAKCGGYACAATAVGIIMKLMGVISLPMWLVLSPLWGTGLAVAVFYALAFLILSGGDT